MAEKKKFKLDAGLEDRIRLALNSTGLRELSDGSADTRFLRKPAHELFVALNAAGMADIDPGTLIGSNNDAVYYLIEDGEKQAYQKLERLIDKDVYQGAKEFFMAELNEDIKASYYMHMLRKGMMPGAPDEKASKGDKEKYESLKELKAKVDLAEHVKRLIKSGKMDEAKALVAKYFDDVRLDILAITSGHYGSPFRDTEKKIYTDFVRELKMGVMNELKDGKFYSLIDKGVDKHEQGRAYSLAGMYNAYGTQKRIEAEIEKTKKEKDVK